MSRKLKCLLARRDVKYSAFFSNKNPFVLRYFTNGVPLRQCYSSSSYLEAIFLNN